MAERRVYIDKELVEFVKTLSDSDSDKRIFNSMAHCLAFAAAYGYKNKNRQPIERAPPKMVAPIHFQIFENARLDNLFSLISLAAEKDYKKVLSDSDESSSLRVTIFEEYAKGGLKLLQNQLSGHIDYLDPIVATILESTNIEKESDGFDTSKLKIK